MSLSMTQLQPVLQLLQISNCRRKCDVVGVIVDDFWESDLNFVTVLLDAINLGHLLLQKPNGAGDRRVHAATIYYQLTYIIRVS